MLVRQEEVREPGDRQVQVDGVDVRPKGAALLSAAQQALERIDQAAIERLDRRRLLQMLPVMDVFDAHQSDEVGCRDEVIECVSDELRHRLAGRLAAQVLILLTGAQTTFDLDGDRYTLPVALASLVGEHVQDTELMMAGAVLTVMPVVVLFLALQRFYIAGVMGGAIKE